jgi:signal transduction histidine kinase
MRLIAEPICKATDSNLKLTAHAAHDITTDEIAKKAFKTIEETSQNAVNEMRTLISKRLRSFNLAASFS